MSRLSVLIVDDEPMFTSALRRLLHRTHDVEIASDGQQALDAVRAGRRFDVILSDVTMPLMSGIELLERLLEVAPDQAEHFVFLTGGTFPGPAQRRLRTLGTRQLEKPIDVAALRTMISEVAGQPPESDEAREARDPGKSRDPHEPHDPPEPPDPASPDRPRRTESFRRDDGPRLEALPSFKSDKDKTRSVSDSDRPRASVRRSDIFSVPSEERLRRALAGEG